MESTLNISPNGHQDQDDQIKEATADVLLPAAGVSSQWSSSNLAGRGGSCSAMALLQMGLSEKNRDYYRTKVDQP